MGTGAEIAIIAAAVAGTAAAGYTAYEASQAEGPIQPDDPAPPPTIDDGTRAGELELKRAQQRRGRLSTISGSESGLAGSLGQVGAPAVSGSLSGLSRSLG